MESRPPIDWRVRALEAEAHLRKLQSLLYEAKLNFCKDERCIEANDCMGHAEIFDPRTQSTKESSRE